MGRGQVKIARLQTEAARKAAFNKRRSGLEKKARELTILTGAQLVLLYFTPAGKPIVVLGNTELGAILERFSKVPVREREKRRRENFEALMKTCRKQNQEVDMKLLAPDRPKATEEQRKRLRELQAKLDEVNKKLSLWNNPELIEDKEQFRRMKETLINNLQRVQEQKQRLLEQNAQKDAATSEAWPHSHSARWSSVNQGASNYPVLHHYAEMMKSKKWNDHHEDEGNGIKLAS